MHSLLNLGLLRQLWTIGTGLGKSRIIGALATLLQAEADEYLNVYIVYGNKLLKERDEKEYK